jgi:hypothetical protein
MATSDGDVGVAPSSTADALTKQCAVTHADATAPYAVVAASAGWVEAAAASLVSNGLCTLESGSSTATALVDGAVLERCCRDARPRLDWLLGLAERSGLQAEGSDLQGSSAAGGAPPLQSQELYSRAPWEHRFDMTMLRRPRRCVVNQTEEAAQEATSSAMWTADDAAWRALLAAVDPIVRPLLLASGLFGCEDELEVEAVGCVISMPGAPDQRWHPDSEEQLGLVNVFVPLVDVDEINGTTALALGTHTPKRASFEECAAEAQVVRPHLQRGSVLCFDWRVWHRGGGNLS